MFCSTLVWGNITQLCGLEVVARSYAKISWGPLAVYSFPRGRAEFPSKKEIRNWQQWVNSDCLYVFHWTGVTKLGVVLWLVNPVELFFWGDPAVCFFWVKCWVILLVHIKFQGMKIENSSKINLYIKWKNKGIFIFNFREMRLQYILN